MRLRKQQGVKEKLSQYPETVILLEEPEIVSWDDIFEKKQPIKLEIGTGKGNFIIEMARQNPSINYIGMELRDQVLLKAVKKALEYDLKNLKFLVADANNIEQLFSSESVNGIYLNFSDPWPKKRHYKRRLTYRGFIEKYNMILQRDSWVIFKTDNLTLFQFTLNELAAVGLPMKKITLDLHNDVEFDNNIMTEYEEKFSNLGNKIMSVTFQTHK